MKKLLQLSFTFLFLSYGVSYAQFFKWGVRSGANNSTGDAAGGVVTDTAGNSVFVGINQPSSVTFGNATSTYTTVTTAGGSDVFVAKVNKNGAYVWVKHFGSKSGDAGTDVGMDKNDNYYVTGYIADTTSFGNSVKLNTAGSFVCQFNTAGTCQWATRVGPGIYESATDVNGNTYITGTFNGVTTIGTFTLTSTGSNDVFVTKVDASGAIVWAVNVGGADDDFAGSTGGITVDGDGNPYIAGSFLNTTTIGSTTITASAGAKTGVFVTKLRSIDGSIVWAKGADGSDTSFDNYLNGISFSKSDQAILLTGSFKGNITWGSTQLSSTADYNPFVAKLDTAGAGVWAAKPSTSTFVKGCGVGSDISGNVFFTGWGIGNGGNISFGTQNLVLSTNSGYVGYIGKINSSGAVQWGKIITNNISIGNYSGFIYPDFGGIDTDNAGNVYQTGNFSGTLGLDAYLMNCNGAPTGFYDAYLAKLDPNATTGIEESITNNSFEIYPNPSNGLINVSFMNTNGSVMNIYNSAGQLIISKKLNAGHGILTESIDMTEFGKGLYLTQIISEGNIANKNFVVE